jgi:hypothetical protein
VENAARKLQIERDAMPFAPDAWQRAVFVFLSGDIRHPVHSATVCRLPAAAARADADSGPTRAEPDGDVADQLLGQQSEACGAQTDLALTTSGAILSINAGLCEQVACKRDITL